MIELFELVDAEGRSFSPNCWRSRMAVAHKGLETKTVPVRFTDIPRIADGTHKTVPVLRDGDRIFGDSWHIALHLEKQYPDRPSLFGGEAGKALTLFVQQWTADVVHRGIIDMILYDIYRRLDGADKDYFRATREKRFGRPLEDVQAGRETRVAGFRKSLLPLRSVLADQAWLGGASPLYGDYLIFGAFQWARVMSEFPMLTDDDPVAAWFEHCLDLFGGLGRRTPAASA